MFLIGQGFFNRMPYVLPQASVADVGHLLSFASNLSSFYLCATAKEDAAQHLLQKLTKTISVLKIRLPNDWSRLLNQKRRAPAQSL